jgi:hypothetical protein
VSHSVSGTTDFDLSLGMNGESENGHENWNFETEDSM